MGLPFKELSYAQADDAVLRNLGTPRIRYWVFVLLAFTGVLVGAACWAYQIMTGVGAAGINHPVMWGTYLINFVWWVGIAHSGTLISAILYLLKARWRNPLARAAEAMTVFAVATAGLFPLIHLGRVWLAYWILPYPNQRDLWPNFQSPLVFDVVAISTYLTVSSLFWYTGLLPDLAAVRDRSRGVKRKIYGLFALGWTGNHLQWAHHGWAYLLLAALATPLVISVHSVVSWDFAMGVVPGWHSTIFAPYFVAGAIHQGLAMVMILLIPMRLLFGLEDILTTRIFERIAQTILLTTLIMGYAYTTEVFIAWYSGLVEERDIFAWRAFGDFALSFWVMIIFNSVAPLAFFFRKLRTRLVPLFLISVIINIGMWYERYVIILSSPAREFDPYSWGHYFGPTWVELGIFIGSLSMFSLAFMLFAKFLPSVSMSELKEEVPPPGRERPEGAP